MKKSIVKIVITELYGVDYIDQPQILEDNINSCIFETEKKGYQLKNIKFCYDNKQTNITYLTFNKGGNNNGK